MGMLRRNPASRHIRPELFSILIDGDQLGGQESWVATHLENCRPCRDEYYEIQETVSLLQSIPMVKPQKSFVLTQQEVQESPSLLNGLFGLRRLGIAMALVGTLLFVGDSMGFIGPSSDSLPIQVGSKALPANIRISGESGPEKSLSLTLVEELSLNPRESRNNKLADQGVFSAETAVVNNSGPKRLSGNSNNKFEFWYLQIGLFVTGIFLFLIGFSRVRRSVR